MNDDASATIELHGARTGNCLRAAIALEEAGLCYVAKRVDLARGEHLGAPHRALNPAGKVPVLVERAQSSSFILAQSNAIMFYAASRGSCSLMPPAETHEGAIAYERYFYFVTDVIAPSHASFALDRHGLGEGSAVLVRQSLLALSEAERFLERGLYMAGALFTLVDVSALTITLASHDNLDWPTLPRLHEWYERMLERPAVDRGLHAFDPKIGS